MADKGYQEVDLDKKKKWSLQNTNMLKVTVKL